MSHWAWEHLNHSQVHFCLRMLQGKKFWGNFGRKKNNHTLRFGIAAAVAAHILNKITVNGNNNNYSINSSNGSSNSNNNDNGIVLMSTNKTKKGKTIWNNKKWLWGIM